MGSYIFSEVHNKNKIIEYHCQCIKVCVIKICTITGSDIFLPFYWFSLKNKALVFYCKCTYCSLLLLLLTLKSAMTPGRYCSLGNERVQWNRSGRHPCTVYGKQAVFKKHFVFFFFQFLPITNDCLDNFWNTEPPWSMSCQMSVPWTKVISKHLLISAYTVSGKIGKKEKANKNSGKAGVG